MALYYEEEIPFCVDFHAKEVAEKVIEQVADTEKIPYAFDVNLTIVDNDAIRQINNEYRGIDRTTDVLSFPNIDFEAPGDFSLIEREEAEADYFDPDTGMLLLGDIVISAEKVKEQAKEYGHSPMREFAFLIAHSMLHLCGYDHIEPEEAAVMEEKQREALEALRITRDS